jgi:archaellum component FlaC
LILLINFFFIKDFFDTLRNKVDLYFTEKEKNETNNDKWLGIIDKMKSIENFTYERLPTNINKINSEVLDEIRNNIQQFENQINNLNSNSTEEQATALKDSKV